MLQNVFRPRRRRPGGCLLAAVLALAAGAPGARAAERLSLVAPTNTVDTVISEVVLRAAYGRLGIDVAVAKYPAERALRLADSGAADGDVQRIDGVAARYGNLIQVRPAINHISGAAFTRNAGLRVDGWKGLAPYRIGVVRGIKFVEENTRGMDVRFVNDYAGLFTKLDRGLFAVAVSPRVNGWVQVHRLGLEGIRELEPPLERFELYHYLHRSHAALATRVGAVFAEMRAAGELQRIRERVVRVLLERARQGLDPCDEDYACFAPPPR